MDLQQLQTPGSFLILMGMAILIGIVFFYTKK